MSEFFSHIFNLYLLPYILSFYLPFFIFYLLYIIERDFFYSSLITNEWRHQWNKKYLKWAILDFLIHCVLCYILSEIAYVIMLNISIYHSFPSPFHSLLRSLRSLWLSFPILSLSCHSPSQLFKFLSLTLSSSLPSNIPFPVPVLSCHFLIFGQYFSVIASTYYW